MCRIDAILVDNGQIFMSTIGNQRNHRPFPTYFKTFYSPVRHRLKRLCSSRLFTDMPNIFNSTS